MFIKALYLIITLLGIKGMSRDFKEAETACKPEIFIIGSIHPMHYNPDYHYSITDLLEQIRALKPDVVCGEIAPEAFDQVTEGYFPPEAVFLNEFLLRI